MKGLGFGLVAIHLAGAVAALGQVQTFRNDYQGFVNAAGPLSTIDFETLPDGLPSVAGTSITSMFNYDAQSAHFSAPLPFPYIAGNDVTGFGLEVFAPVNQRTWIIADLTSPARSVGVFYPGDTTLCAFSSVGAQLGCAHYEGPGGGIYFLGVVSIIPISRITVDRGSRIEAITSFVYSPVPEPATILLLGLGGWFVMRVRNSPSR